MPKSLDSISKTKKEKPAETPAETPATPVAPPSSTPEAAPVSPSPAAASPTPDKKEEPVVEEIKPSEPSATLPPTEIKDGAVLPPLEPEAAADLAPDDQYASLFPEPTVVISNPPTWIWWILLIIGSAGLAFLGYNIANGRINDWLSTTATATPAASPTPTATPSATATPTATPAATTTPTATPTPSSSVDKKSVTLRVLNGTTKAGAASTGKTILEQAGFTVRTIGNAQHQNYTSTVIYYQTGKQAEAQAVQSALSKYKSTLQESSGLASPDMVLVVLGPAS